MGRHVARAFASWVLVGGLACGGGGDVEPLAAEPPAAPPERLPENRARTDPDAPCTTGIPASTAFCAMPFEETALEFVGQSSTTKDGCTQLYVASRGLGDDVARVRRYKMTGVDVCGFARDEAFGEPRAKLSAISASDDGAVFGLGHRVVRRVAPGPVVDCVAHGVTLGDRALLAIAPRGGTGYVGWNDGSFHIAKLNASVEGCEVTPFLAGLVSLPRAAAITVDARGRLHVLERNYGHILQRVSILDEGGLIAGTYETLAGADFMGPDVTISSCVGGTCVSSYGAVASFDAQGKLLAQQREEMGADGLFLGLAFVGSVGGPLLRIGFGWQSRPGLRIQTIRVP